MISLYPVSNDTPNYPTPTFESPVTTTGLVLTAVVLAVACKGYALVASRSPLLFRYNSAGVLPCAPFFSAEKGGERQIKSRICCVLTKPEHEAWSDFRLTCSEGELPLATAAKAGAVGGKGIFGGESFLRNRLERSPKIIFEKGGERHLLYFHSVSPTATTYKLEQAREESSSPEMRWVELDVIQSEELSPLFAEIFRHPKTQAFLADFTEGPHQKPADRVIEGL